MSWIGGVLIAIDQLGNAIAGGNPDATISARTGYFANEVKTAFQFYWKTMELIINFAFYPIDGPNHCYNEYLADKDDHIAGSFGFNYYCVLYSNLGGHSNLCFSIPGSKIYDLITYIYAELCHQSAITLPTAGLTR